MLTAVIDADPLLYIIGFMGQKNIWRVFPNGEKEYVMSSNSKADVNAWLKQQGENSRRMEVVKSANGAEIHKGTDFYLEKDIEVEPISHALHILKLTLGQIMEDTGAEAYKLFLSPSRNYRYDLFEDYKSGRTAPKPILYEDIRNYLIEHWDAEVVDNIEADDAVSIYCLEDPDNRILCTIDKDLDQVPVMHYNYDSKKRAKYRISPEQGMNYFYYQMLMGDSTDSIPGIPGIGEAKAQELVTLFKSDEDLYDMVLGQYKEHDWDGIPAEDVMKLNGQLLWMLRRPLDAELTATLDWIPESRR